MIVVSAIVVGLPLLAGGTLYILGRMATSRWEAKLAELRAKGEPITFEEIERRRATVPDELNGALIIEELSDLLGGPVDGSRPEGGLQADAVPDHVLIFKPAPELDPEGGTPRYAIDASREFLQEHVDILTRLGALDDRLTGRFTFAVAPIPVMTLLPHLTPVRNAAKLIRLDAALKLVDGDLTGACVDAKRLFHLAGTLRDEPTVISRLVSVAVQAAAAATIEDTLSAGELDSSELTRLADVIDWHLENMTDRPAFWGERAMILSMFDAVAAGKLDPSTAASSAGSAGPWKPSFLLPVLVTRSNQLFAVTMLTEFVSDADDTTKLMATAARQRTTMMTASRIQVFSKMLMPSYERATMLMGRIRAVLTCLRTAIAAEQFRLANGRFPDSLGELVPMYVATTPTDPFTGTSLLLQVQDGAIVLYSVGEDGEDDGGSIERLHGEKIPLDAGVRLLPPDRRGVLITDEPPPEDDELSG